ncbi:2-(3-amino-3-carboxypropyl)histidine synthase [Candidatus Gugararchaeum adminiculabundum]|nr:2-(3-amino-3-carboxypropyl)histidine synthase [Candidatus Gugararchaeum adminiculabundum]
MRILLQFPEGLKQIALGEAKKLEKQGHDVFISGSPCYGACDLALDEARWIKADKIIHFGHSKFAEFETWGIKVEYNHYPVTAKLDSIKKALKSELKDYKKIGLATTVQHLHQLKEIKKILEAAGKQVFVGKGGHLQEEGQVLGCDAGAIKSIDSKVDAILYFGAGLFHPLGMDTAKPLLQVNPYSGKITWLTAEIEKELRRRKGALLKASEANSFAILVSTKPGQFNIVAAESCKKKLEAKNRSAAIIVCNELSSLSLQNFLKFDAYISTACPRLQDDSELFQKPVINWTELGKLLELL